MPLDSESQKALNAVIAGKDPAAEVYGEEYADSEYVIDDTVNQPLDTTSTLTDLLGQDEQDADLSQNQDSQDPVEELANSDATTDQETSGDESDDSSDDSFEMITISDAKGRREVKIDYNDRDTIKKYAKMAYGMRKFQNERDQSLAREKQKDTKIAELEANWEAIEGVYKDRGLEGLVDLLEEREGAFKDYEKSLIDRYELRRDATPEELEALDARDRAIRLERELERERQAREKFQEQMTAKEEAAEVAALESMVNPVFDKYRFAGKLGDKRAEHRLDKALHRDVIEELIEYESQGHQLTPALVNRVTRKLANETRQYMKEVTNKRVKKAVKQKKQEATENAQNKVMSGFKGNSVAQEAVDLINAPGGLTKLIQGWGKYGKVFNK
jgi:hypothetical protein